MLLLYITSDENMGLVDTQWNESNIVVKQMNGEFNLNQLVINDTSNLSCCQYLAIDLTSLTDSDDEIIDALVGLKSMYDFRIIIIACGYETHNLILGRIFAEGIYNIITATRHAEIQERVEMCITDGLQYKDAIKYRLQNDYAPSRNKRNKQTQSKVIIQKQSIKQTISVGISGALHRIGTTKQALHITKFLCDNGYRACYIENNDHGHIGEMVGFYEVNEHDDYFTYDGIDIFPTFDMGAILAGGYDFVIYDNGLFDETNKRKFLEYDFKIICAGTNPWEAPHINPIFEEVGNYDDIYFIFSFASLDLQHEISNLMDKFKRKTFFAEYAPIVVDGITNAKSYKKLFDGYIHEKQQIIPKKGLFDRLKI